MVIIIFGPSQKPFERRPQTLQNYFDIKYWFNTTPNGLFWTFATIE